MNAYTEDREYIQAKAENEEADDNIDYGTGEEFEGHEHEEEDDPLSGYDNDDLGDGREL